jgi:TolB-like protein
MIREQPHVPLRQLAPQHPAELERMIGRLLAKRPADRYQSARDLRADLVALQAAAQKRFVAGSQSPHRRAASIAVMTFDAIGATDVDGLSFRDGLAEDVSSRLGTLPDLRVAPRVSTRAVQGQSVREIARRLGVDLILEGTTQAAAGRVRVTANLVDAEAERSLLPAFRIDRPFADVLATQDDVAREICDTLAPALARLSRRYTPEPEAYHAFKRGQHHWQSCFTGGWRRAIEHFEYAIARDPQFAEAHVALANAYNFGGFYSLMKPGPSFSVAAKAAANAIAVGAGLASAHRELALAKFGGEWDWEGSEASFRLALALDADDALTHVHYSWLLILLGREDAAYAEAQKGQALAPNSRLVATARAQTLYIGGRYDEAIEICNHCLHIDPTYLFAVHLRGLCYLALSVRDGAVADLEQAARLGNRAPFYLGLLGRCYGQFGMTAEALALIGELQQQARDVYVPPQCYVFIYAGLGEHERALAFQESAYADGASPFNYLSPSIRELYALDPYHKRRLEQMRLNL